jgi:hypothetical protein
MQYDFSALVTLHMGKQHADKTMVMKLTGFGTIEEKQTRPLPMNSMEQTPLQVTSCSADQEISKLLWKPKFHYCVHKIPLSDLTLSQ